MTDGHILTGLPAYVTENGNISEAFDCGYGNAGISAEQTTEAEYDAYLAALAERGYKTYAENRIGVCRFGTYIGGEKRDTAVHTAYYPNTERVKIVCGPRAYLPAAERIPAPTGDGVRARATITQLGRLAMYQFNNGAPGLCYIIQLADGRYIVMDGGPTDRLVEPMKKTDDGEWVRDGEPRMSEDMKSLYEYLVANNPDKSEGAKPVVAAWFFTHAHSDHIELPTEFFKVYKDAVVLEMAVHNFPNHKTTAMRDGSSPWLDGLVTRLLEAINESFPSVVHYVPHAGDKLNFAGCEIEFFYTHEDFYPNQLYSANDASLCFRVTMGGKTFMVMGDCDTRVSRMIAANYGTALKSDILQVNHHGANGGDIELYKYISPDICLWDVSDYVFYTNPQQLGTAKHYEFNAWIRENVSTHYIETETHVIPCDGE